METTTARKGTKLSEKEILKHEFLAIAEVALLLRVTQRTVYNLIYNGSLRAIKITTRIIQIEKELSRIVIKKLLLTLLSKYGNYEIRR